MDEAAGLNQRERGRPALEAHPQDFFPSSPMSGWANPMSPPIDLWAVEGEDGRPEIRGRAIFPTSYEGPPTCVHGGVIALLFDEILGSANLVADTPGMTGTLTVRYRRPTPLLTELELWARSEGVEGRKILTRASISVGGELTAEAEAIFISVPPEQMVGIAGRNAANAKGEVIDPTMRAAMESGAY